MRIEVIPQFALGDVGRIRVGDVLNRVIADSFCRRFRFAVAYMRLSGLDRLGVSIEALLNRDGTIAGVVGIDDAITSLESLDALRRLSTDSTVFHTVTGYIFHPKFYLMSGDAEAVAIIGSSNLTRDGLFRNLEISAAIYLDFNLSEDLETYNQLDEIIEELLNTSHPNVQPINDETLTELISSGLISEESRTNEPGPSIRTRESGMEAGIGHLFPQLHVPVAPPARPFPSEPPTPTETTDVLAGEPVGTFVMQLSAFDSSHRSGVPGTPEVLIPHGAIAFFPPLAMTGRRYPDAFFDCVLNTPTGRERHQYRLWYYEQRATGTRIDEYRLRLDRETIDLSSQGGGDLLVINRLVEGSDPLYETTILQQHTPMFRDFFRLCTFETQGKRWGLV